MNIRALLLGLIFVIIWSSAFTSARIIVLYSSPLAALSIRFFISGLIGVFIALALGQSFKLTKSQWRATFVFGLCQNALYLGLNFVAMQSMVICIGASFLFWGSWSSTWVFWSNDNYVGQINPWCRYFWFGALCHWSTSAYCSYTHT